MRPSGRVIAVAAWLVAAIWAVGSLVAIYPVLTGRTDVEASWRAVLAWAFASGKVFGRDILFSHGPWGLAIYQDYVPGAWPWAVTAQIVITFALLLGWTKIWTTSREGPARQKALLLAAALIIPIASLIRCNPAIDPVYPLLAWLFLLITLRESPRWIEITLAITLALLAQMKFTAFPMGLWIMAIATIAAIRQRRIPVGPIAFLLAFPFWWLAAGQPLTAIPDWLKWSLNFAKGYVDAHSLPSDPWAVGAFLLAAPALIYATPNLYQRLALVGILFLTFKGGYVRGDIWHEVAAASSLALLAVTHFTQTPLQRSRKIAASIVLALSAAMLLRADLRANPPGQFFSPLARQPIEIAEKYINFFQLLANPSRLSAAYAAIPRTDPPLPETSSLDVMGRRQRRVLLAGAPYAPRPMFQDYAVVTPELARRNAEFIAERGPQTLLLELFPIDGKFSPTEDPLVWEQLLHWYDPAGSLGKEELLRRRTRPRTVQRQQLSSITVPFGAPIDVPQAPLVWAEIRIQPTLAGSLRSFFWKPAPTTLWLEPAVNPQNTKLPTRFVASMGEVGFLLSPAVWTSSQLSSLLTNTSTARPIGRITLTADSWGYQPNVQVTFYQLIVTEPPSAEASTPTAIPPHP